MKKSEKLFLGIIALIIVTVTMATLIFGMRDKAAQTPTAYTVQKGDTLFSIAVDHDIDDWRKWAYQVCEINDIPQGGEIYPGDEIIILTKE